MQGTRLYLGREATDEEASTLDDKVPGSFWYQGPLSGWHCVTPNGLHGWLKNHKVIEHEDGMISVLPPGPGEPANSILVGNGTGNKSWHGFIYHGDWRGC